MKPATFAYEEDTLTNRATWPDSGIPFKKCGSQQPAWPPMISTWYSHLCVVPCQNNEADLDSKQKVANVIVYNTMKSTVASSTLALSLGSLALGSQLPCCEETQTFKQPCGQVHVASGQQTLYKQATLKADWLAQG